MKIHMVSDLHGYQPTMPGGDLLIIAGDLTAHDTQRDYGIFFQWLQDQEYRKIVIIAGNHDTYLVYPHVLTQFKYFCDFTYLYDSGTEFEGLKIWGTPWSLKFKGINPKCTAFTGTEYTLSHKYDLIPYHLDILISHSPAWLILDEIKREDRPENSNIENVGSKALLPILQFGKPKLFVCGHIHENGLKTCLYNHQGTNTMCVNASYVDEHYRPRNAFMSCEWDGHNFVKFDKVIID